MVEFVCGYRKLAPDTKKTLLLGLAASFVDDSFSCHDFGSGPSLKGEFGRRLSKFLRLPRVSNIFHATHFGQRRHFGWGNVLGFALLSLFLDALHGSLELFSIGFHFQLGLGVEFLIKPVPILLILRLASLLLPIVNIFLDKFHP